jgi:hypothetical protein
VWDKVKEGNLLEVNNINRWNEYSDVLEIIFAFQISQNSIHQKKAKKE